MNLTSAAAGLIKRERAQRQWGLRRAAREAGVAVGTWQGIESGGGFDYQSLVKIVVAFGWGPEMADRLLEMKDGDPAALPSLDELRAADPEAHDRVMELASLLAARASGAAPVSTEAAIEADQRLTSEAKAVLLRVYRGLVDGE